MYNEKNCYSIHGLPVLQDNIIWIWVRESEAVVIDPSLSKPVESWLKAHSLNLIGVLQTHHHDDHIGGTLDLLDHWPKAAVVASKADIKRIPFQTISVSDKDEIYFMGCQVKVLDVAGHTKAHIAYYLPPQNGIASSPSLFCGDTLFGAGCGRLFEGTAENMYKALGRLNSLPENTKIYCAHEYTEANLRWAETIRPNDLSIKKRLKEVTIKRGKGLLSIPSSIREERETNLFIRAKSIEEFAKLRLHKDNWKREDSQ